MNTTAFVDVLMEKMYWITRVIKVYDKILISEKFQSVKGKITYSSVLNSHSWIRWIENTVITSKCCTLHIRKVLMKYLRCNSYNTTKRTTKNATVYFINELYIKLEVNCSQETESPLFRDLHVFSCCTFGKYWPRF